MMTTKSLTLPKYKFTLGKNDLLEKIKSFVTDSSLFCLTGNEARVENISDPVSKKVNTEQIDSRGNLLYRS